MPFSILSSKTTMFRFSLETVPALVYDYPKVVVTNDCKGFVVVVTFAALVVDVVLANEAAVVVPHWELVVVLGFDAVAAYVVDVLDSGVVVAFFSCRVSNCCCCV